MSKEQQFFEALTRNLEAQTKALEGLAKDNGDHTKSTASVHTGTLLHGPQGIFTGPGLERDVISAHVRPRGISTVLPIFPSISTHPYFASLTGVTDDIGDEITNACEDAPTGYIKSCYLTAAFGLARRDTNTIEFDSVMRTVNRGDFTDLMLRGQLLGMTENLVPSGLSQSQILNIVTMAEMVQTGIRMERLLHTRYWQGNFALGQMPGLDSQIATGQVDAKTNQACPALDSDVKSFAYNDVCGTTLDIVEYMEAMAYYLEWNAVSMGLDPVEWVIVMRPPLWQVLSECWPCAYNTNARCSGVVTGQERIFVAGDQMVAERDRMRSDKSITLNGREYQVVLDTGIFEHNNANNGNLNAGQFASSIYFVPLTITQNFPVTYVEYQDYREGSDDVSLLRGFQEFFWTDNGAFSWAYEGTKWCYNLALKSERRVVLRTPQLAGKIDYVMYEPLQHTREPDPDSPYHYDGGLSARAGETSYHVW